MAIVTCVRCEHASDTENLLDPTRSDGAIHLDGSICPATPPIDIASLKIEGVSDEEWDALARALNEEDDWQGRLVAVCNALVDNWEGRIADYVNEIRELLEERDYRQPDG